MDEEYGTWENWEASIDNSEANFQNDAGVDFTDPGQGGVDEFQDFGGTKIEKSAIVTTATGAPATPSIVGNIGARFGDFIPANTISPPAEQAAAGANGLPSWLGSFLSDLAGAAKKGLLNAAPDIANKVARSIAGVPQAKAPTNRMALSGSIGGISTTTLLLAGGLFFLARK